MLSVVITSLWRSFSFPLCTKNPSAAGISLKIPAAVFRPEEGLGTGTHPEIQQKKMYLNTKIFSKGRVYSFYCTKIAKWFPPEITQTHTQQGGMQEGAVRIQKGGKAPSHRHQGKVKREISCLCTWQILSTRSQQCHCSRESCDTEGCRKRRTNSQLLRSWRKLPSNKDWQYMVWTWLPEKNPSSLSTALSSNVTLPGTVSFKYQLCSLATLNSPSDHLYFNSFRHLKKSNSRNPNNKLRVVLHLPLVTILHTFRASKWGEKMPTVWDQRSISQEEFFGNGYKAVHNPMKFQQFLLFGSSWLKAEAAEHTHSRTSSSTVTNSHKTLP